MTTDDLQSLLAALPPEKRWDLYEPFDDKRAEALADLRTRLDLAESDLTIQRNLAEEAVRQRDAARGELAKAPPIKCNGCGHWFALKPRDSKPDLSWYAEPHYCHAMPPNPYPDDDAPPSPCPECLMTDQHKLQCSRREDGGQVVVKARESDCSECGGSGVSYIAQPRTQSNKDVPCPKCTGKSPSGKGGA